MDELFLNAVVETIGLNSTSNQLISFADHLTINKLLSKRWLAEQVLSITKPRHVLLLGSWYPTYLPYLLRANKYTCVDLDENVIDLSKQFNDLLYQGTVEFEYVVGDAEDWLQKDHSKYDVVINTSCEHMNFDFNSVQLNYTSLYALQSNNYVEIKEHINCKESLESFVQSSGLSDIEYMGSKQLQGIQQYERFMIIGRL